jgi:hypothetical protein
MSRLVVISGLLLLFTACKNKDRVPGNIIPQKKIQAVLWDMMRADQFLANYVLNKDTAKKIETESLKYYQQIFAIHKISREEFQRSFSYYRSRPDMFRSIMDSISAPPGSVIVSSPGQETTPLAVPDSTVRKLPGTSTDSPLLRRKRPAVVD